MLVEDQERGGEDKGILKILELVKDGERGEKISF